MTKGKEYEHNVKKKALIIAVSDYDNLPKSRQLPFCRNDGLALYKVLKKQRYEIGPDESKLIGRVTGEEMKQATFDFFRENAKEDDMLLFYFSGHGIPDSFGDHFLASSDIRTNDKALEQYGLSFDDLEKYMKKTPARKIVTIIDCCFSGALGLKGGTEDDTINIARGAMERIFTEGSGRCILASSLGEQSSFKMKDQEYSRFTYFLLQGLKGGSGKAVNDKGYVTPVTLSNYIYENIPLLTQQKPMTKFEMSGDIAIAYYRKLGKRINQTDIDYFMELAYGALSKAQYRIADGYFNSATKIDPKHAEAWRGKGMVHILEGSYDSAMECLDKAIKLEPTDGRLLIDKGHILLNIRQYDEANLCFDKAKELGVESSNAWHGKALTYIILGKYTEVIDFCNKALELDAKNSDAWQAKALAFILLENYQEAIKCVDKALEINPKDRLALKAMAYGTDIIGHSPESIRYYEKALEVNPSDITTWIDKAYAHINSHQFNEAKNCFDKAIQLDASNADALQGSGFACLCLRKYSDAIELYVKALDIASTTSAYHGKALTLLNLRQYDEAIRFFDKALEINPKDRLALKGKLFALDSYWLISNV